ncbi:MAG: glucosamine-6-phosphate deaminase [Gemmatimonadales bacterium]|jgi:glucosamine-6-phosphate deaminase|nr:glucosamine-6-phosphate deaminase [Gemmatimonadales bacterium]
MNIRRFPTSTELADAAAAQATEALTRAIAARGRARIVAATGSAQFEFLSVLTRTPGIDWGRVEMFHLDEYVGLSADHPASFRRFLLERLIRPAGIGTYHLLDGDTGDPEAVCERVGRELQAAPVDVTFMGIGENGHIAFNDPPADFETERPYIVVELDEVCRRQQVGEGWFASLAEVPTRALSMSVKQLLRSDELICIVPQSRKAKAVQAAVEGPITPMVPSSILRTHPNVTLYLDAESSSLLREARS